MRRKRFAALMLVCMFLLNMVSCAEVPDVSVTETSAVVTTQEVTTEMTTQVTTTETTAETAASITTTAPHTTLPVTTTQKVTVPTTVEKTTKATTTQKVTEKTTEKTTVTTTAKVTTTKVTEPKPQSGTCYWVTSGEVYHSTKNCATLKRSKKIYSGTVDEAVALGKNRPCKVCS